MLKKKCYTLIMTAIADCCTQEFMLSFIRLLYSDQGVGLSEAY